MKERREERRMMKEGMGREEGKGGDEDDDGGGGGGCGRVRASTGGREIWGPRANHGERLPVSRTWTNLER